MDRKLLSVNKIHSFSCNFFLTVYIYMINMNSKSSYPLIQKVAKTFFPNFFSCTSHVKIWSVFFPRRKKSHQVKNASLEISVRPKLELPKPKKSLGGNSKEFFHHCNMQQCLETKFYNTTRKMYSTVHSDSISFQFVRLINLTYSLSL